jgi:signal transduction histidine kinase
VNARPLLRPIPRSISGRFRLVLSGLALLVLAQGSTAVWALRSAARSSDELARDRVARLQDAQDLVQRTMLIERQAGQLLDAGALDRVAAEYAAMLQQLDALDALLARLGAASSDVELLGLQQAGQLFRNTVHVVARLRSDVLQDELELGRALREREAALLRSPAAGAEPLAAVLARLRAAETPARVDELRRQFLDRAGDGAGLPAVVRGDLRVLRAAADAAREPREPFALRARLLDRRATLARFHDALHDQTIRMVASAQALSEGFTADYRSAVGALAARTRASERWVLALLTGSLALAWLVAPVLLRRQVLGRLQAVSEHLRRGDAGEDPPQVPVAGDDEIAEMARAVERLLVDRQRLAEANRELEAFSASISHDLRAPIRHLEGFSALLRERAAGVLDAQGRHYLKAVSDAARRMGTEIDGLLSFLRMRHADMVIAPVDLGALAQEVVAEVAADAAGRAIAWDVATLPTVPGDRPMLRLALASLVSNAVKFTAERDRAQIAIGRAAPDGADEVVVFVRDNGVGFDQKYADRLFRVFHRLHRTEDFVGTGIGLASVRRIVERHGGRTWAEGAPGKGATFFMALPTAVAGGTARTTEEPGAGEG